MKSTRKGFTLIELLIVIAIIAILAAILFPVFARARENARRASCQSNLKQIGLAIAQYSQDYDEKQPLIKGYDLSWNTTESWDMAISPYAGVKVTSSSSPQIFQCPSDSVNRVTANAQRRSYGINSAYDWNGGPGIAEDTSAPNRNSLMTMKPLATINDAAGTIMVAEYYDQYNMLASADGVEIRSPVKPSWAWSSYGAQQDANLNPKPAHFDGWNYLFADGHVKWLRPDRTVGTGSVSSPRGMWTITEND